MTAARMAAWFLKSIAVVLITIGMWTIVFAMVDVEVSVGIRLLFGAFFFGFGLYGMVAFSDLPYQPKTESLPPHTTLPSKPVYIPPEIPMASVIQFGERQCVYLLYTTFGLYRIGLSNHA